MDGYIAARRGILARQKTPQTAIIGIDDDLSRSIADALAGAGAQLIVPISAETRARRGVYVEEGWLIDDMAAPAPSAVQPPPAAPAPPPHPPPDTPPAD